MKKKTRSHSLFSYLLSLDRKLVHTDVLFLAGSKIVLSLSKEKGAKGGGRSGNGGR